MAVALGCRDPSDMPVVMATTVRRIKHEMKIRRSLSMTPSKLRRAEVTTIAPVIVSRF